jgi:hypothetical protein
MSKENDEVERISINDSPFPVTKTIRDALRRVRSKIELRCFWLDAISVDQNNLQEKSTQAGLLREVFSRAKSVLMYVGEPEDLSVTDPDYAKWFKQDEYKKQDLYCSSIKKVLDLDTYDWTNITNIPAFFINPLNPAEWPVLGALCIIYHLSKDTHFGDMPFFKKQDEEPYHTNYAWRKSAVALAALFNKPYWHSAWMLQEVATAKNPVVYYGSHIMPFEYFVKAGRNILQHSQECCKEFEEKTTIRVEGSVSESIFPGWLSIISGSLSLIQPTKYQMIESFRERGAPFAVSLREVLENAHIWRDAADPKDMVFSAVGLVYNSKIEPVRIDYSLSVAEVFSNTAIRVFEDDENISALEFNNAGRDNTVRIPSWVPDWRLESETESRLGRRLRCFPLQYSQFAASKGSKFGGRIQSDMCLAVQSIKVDRIAAVGSYWVPEGGIQERNWTVLGYKTQPPESIISQLSEWRQIAGLANENHSSRKEKEFWRTVFADTISFKDDDGPVKHRRMTDKDFHDIHNFASRSRTQEPPKAIEELYFGSGPNLGSFHQSTSSRRFFVTEQGKFGLGLASQNNVMEVDDEIHVIEGSDLPVTLRRVIRTASEESPYLLAAPIEDCTHLKNPVYQLMGFVYLEGVMLGEAVARKQGFSQIYIR